MNKVLKIILILIFTYLIISAFFFFFQEKFIFHPEKLNQNYQFNFKNATEVFLTTHDKAQHHSLFFKQGKENKAKGLVLYFHGNGGLLSRSGYSAKQFNDLGYDVFMVDYRTYGKSTGNMSEANLYNDAQLVYDYLLDDYEQNEIIIYGRSLGSGIACWLAYENNPKMLILDSPFYNMKSVIKDINFLFGVLPIDMILKYKFENNIRIANVNCPVFIFHGTKDNVIPYINSIKLKPIIKNGAFIAVEGANHNNIVEYQEHQNELKSILL